MRPYSKLGKGTKIFLIFAQLMDTKIGGRLAIFIHCEKVHLLLYFFLIPSILFYFFSRPFHSNQKTENHISLSPFPFSVCPHFSSQPNSVKIEWSSHKECEEMGDTGKRNLMIIIRKTIKTKWGLCVVVLVRLPHVIKSDVSRHMLLIRFLFQKPLIALFA